MCVGMGSFVEAATLNVTSALRANWFNETSGDPLGGTPVTLAIEFDETQTGASVTGNGWITIAGVRQQGISGRIGFTTLSGSGTANGAIMSVSVLLDDQPLVDRSIFVPGRGLVPIFVDENPDQLPLSVDLNRLDINLYGAPVGGDSAFAAPIGQTIADFIAIPRQAGQRLVYYSGQSVSQIFGPDGPNATTLLTTSQSGGGVTASVPLPASLGFMAFALAGLSAFRRHSQAR
jgi:hypothetical protein